jgi:hypothetical protein
MPSDTIQFKFVVFRLQLSPAYPVLYGIPPSLIQVLGGPLKRPANKLHLSTGPKSSKQNSTFNLPMKEIEYFLSFDAT